MEVEETRLPGIGTKHELTTGEGRHVGVVRKRAGGRELAVYDEADPDACLVTLALSDEEADVLAELLGAPSIIERLQRLNEQVKGIVTEAVVIDAGSPFDGRTIAESMTRARTGSSIVAVLRGGEMVLGPGAEFRFAPGDTAVIVGSATGTAAAARLLSGA